MSVNMPVFRSHKVKGYTFNFSYPLDSQRLVIEPLMGTGRLIKARLHLAAEHVEVKVGPESSVEAVCAGLNSIDRHFRMEVFSLSSEEEFCALKELQQSGRAIFVSGFQRPWNELELIRICRAYGLVEELTCFFGDDSFRDDQAIVLFKDLSSKINCLALIQNRALPFSVRRFESVDLAAQRIHGPGSLFPAAQTNQKIERPATADHDAADPAPLDQLSVRAASELPRHAPYRLESLAGCRLVSSDALLGSTLQLQLASSKCRETFRASPRSGPGAPGPRRAKGRSASAARSPGLTRRRQQLLDHDIPEDRRRPPRHETIDLGRWAVRGDDLETSFLSSSALSRGYSGEEAKLAPSEPAARVSPGLACALAGDLPPVPSARAVPLEQHLLPSVLPAPEPAGPGPSEEAGHAWLAVSRASGRRIAVAYKQAHISYFAFPDESPTNSQSQA